MKLLGGHIYFPLLWPACEGIFPLNLWPLALPLCILKEKGQCPVWQNWERNQHTQLNLLSYCFLESSLPEEEGRLLLGETSLSWGKAGWLCSSSWTPACQQKETTGSTMRCATNSRAFWFLIFPTHLPYFTFYSECRWRGGSYYCFSPIIKLYLCLLQGKMLQLPQLFLSVSQFISVGSFLL